MDIENISTNSEWGNEAGKVNSNNLKFKTEIEKLQYSTVRDKGYFSTDTALTTAIPNPQVGDYANVAGILYECMVAGSWTNTGTSAPIPELDLTEYAKTTDTTGTVIRSGELAQNTGQSTTQAPSLKLFTDTTDKINYKTDSLFTQESLLDSLSIDSGRSKSKGLKTVVAGFKCSTDLISCTPKDLVFYTGTIYSSSLAGVVYFGATGNYLGFQFDSTLGTSSSYDNEKLIIPVNAAFFAFTGMDDYDFTVVRYNPRAITEEKLLQQATPYINNSITDNCGIDGAEDWINEIIYAKPAAMTVVRSEMSSPVSKSSIQGIGYSSTNNSNYMGRYVDISDIASVGDTIIFKGMFYVPSDYGINTINIVVQQRSSANALLNTSTFVQANIKKGNWNEFYTEVVVVDDSKYASCLIRNFPLNAIVNVAGWTLYNKKLETNYKYKITHGNNALDDIGNTVIYVDASNVSDGTGTSQNPFKSLNTAIQKCIGRSYTKIIVSAGILRETLNFSMMAFENIEIVSANPDVVQLFGSDTISGWTKTSGYTNIYEASFSGTIPVWSRAANPIFEFGNLSMDIPIEDQSPLFNGLDKILPFTVINMVNDLTACDSTPSSYYLDTANSKLYIHTTNSDNPETNGFSYENIVRDAIIPPVVSNRKVKPNLILKNIQFLFHKGVKFQGFNMVNRYMCSSYGSSGVGGFIDNLPFISTYRDFSAYCDGDGINGHYSAQPDSTNQDQKEGLLFAIYTDACCVYNLDDGLSHHERGAISLHGGYFYNNADGGVRISNDAVYTIFNAHANKNGWDNSAGTSGSGFDIVNPPSMNRIGARGYLYNCISENNRIGFGIITGSETDKHYMKLINPVSRNNSQAEYYSASGIMDLYNAKAYNTDQSKIKVESGSGIIIVNHASIVE